MKIDKMLKPEIYGHGSKLFHYNNTITQKTI